MSPLGPRSPSSDEVKALIAALVRERHQYQYLHDPEFHGNVHLLAQLLPLWVEAISDEASRRVHPPLAGGVVDPSNVPHVSEQGFIPPSPYDWGLEK